ncbi:MAG: prepilin peptidase [Lachnospiraceae bacterium]|nr:prepilin peptidase [Lachnospiraceae bacterium]
MIKEFIFLLFLTVGSLSDIKSRRVDNGLVLWALMSIGLYYLLSGNYSGLLHGSKASLITLLLLFPFYLMHFIGAGDIKFLMTAVFFTGGQVLIKSIIYIALSAILIVIFIFLKTKNIKKLTYPAIVPISFGLLCGVQVYSR